MMVVMAITYSGNEILMVQFVEVPPPDKYDAHCRTTTSFSLLYLCYKFTTMIQSLSFHLPEMPENNAFLLYPLQRDFPIIPYETPDVKQCKQLTVRKMLC
jgi:hypothetical protein